ncbi:MAG: Flp family type IVb pilin [Desulfuromonadales bacterium]|nr:Flp family type IVb pilin [Desulfuromonadales bacterium]
MKALVLHIKMALQDEEGATATEYAIMLVLILLAAFAAIGLLGGQVAEAFERFVSLFAENQS